jgi:hypothetical protein
VRDVSLHTRLSLRDVLGVVVEPLHVVVARDEPEAERLDEVDGSEARSACRNGLGSSAASISKKGSLIADLRLA